MSVQRQRGASLVMATFVLVVLALLAAALVNILGAGGESVAREVISTRALFLANSGAQRKLTELFPPGDTASLPAACSPSTAYPATEWQGITGCTTLNVDVTCRRIEVDGINYYTLTSTASCGPATDPAVRIVEVQAKDGI